MLEATMKKLTLDPDALAVESFEAEARTERPRGTVEARSGESEACSFECTDQHSCTWSALNCETQQCNTIVHTCQLWASCCPMICE
jgi:hypothetical protein